MNTVSQTLKFNSLLCFFTLVLIACQSTSFRDRDYFDVDVFVDKINHWVEAPASNFSLGKPLDPTVRYINDESIVLLAMQSGSKENYLDIEKLAYPVFRKLLKNPSDPVLIKAAKIINTFGDGEYAPFMRDIIEDWEDETGLKF